MGAERRPLAAPVEGAERDDDGDDEQLGDERVAVRRRPERGQLFEMRPRRYDTKQRDASAGHEGER